MKLKRSMVHWACRRGILELDILIHRFFEKKFKKLNSSQKKSFFNMLMYDDYNLYKWLVCNKIPKIKSIQKIVILIKDSFK
ncbi:MAG: succinate dehydrogenase assembly factor 2 [Wigglesworthia glossinidia]|nr:succinate dehydrogenase assembly factor 2 [Wigglesworthia glossinidia]